MSTNALVAYLNEDNSVVSSYVHWDDLDDYVTIYNIATNRRKRVLVDKIKKIIAKGEYNNEFKT